MKDESAFPRSVRRTENYMDEGGYGRARTVTINEGGLTKREYFAAKALEGLLASGEKLTERVGSRAVEYADSLIEALEGEE